MAGPGHTEEIRVLSFEERKRCRKAFEMFVDSSKKTQIWEIKQMKT